MSFADALRRLRNAADSGTRGVRVDRAIVERQDLRDLLYQFDRLDEEARTPLIPELEGALREIRKTLGACYEDMDNAAGFARRAAEEILDLRAEVAKVKDSLKQIGYGGKGGNSQ